MEVSNIPFHSNPLARSSSLNNNVYNEPLNLFPDTRPNSLEPLPLLSSLLCPPKAGALEGNHKTCNEDVTVALCIGLPDNNNKDVSKNADDKKDSDLAATQKYWIPTPAQILIGFTHFSCHICDKTFNRFNNLQVQLLMHLISFNFHSLYMCSYCILHIFFW